MAEEIEAVGDINVLDRLIGAVERGQESGIEITRNLTDGGKTEIINWTKIERELQPEQPPAPDRKESRPRAHHFHEVEGFIEYLRRYGCRDTVVFGNARSRAVYAVLKDTAKTQFEVVMLKPFLHPLLACWMDILGERIEIRQLAEKTMEMRRTVARPDGRELALILAQITATSTATIHRGTGNKCLNGVVVQTTIQGQRKDEHVELPDSITISVPVFLGEDETSLDLDLLVGASREPGGASREPGGASREDVYGRLSCPDLQVRLVEGFQLIMAKLAAASEDEKAGWVVSLGRPEYGEWDYIKPAKLQESRREDRDRSVRV